MPGFIYEQKELWSVSDALHLASLEKRLSDACQAFEECLLMSSRWAMVPALRLIEQGVSSTTESVVNKQTNGWLWDDQGTISEQLWDDYGITLGMIMEWFWKTYGMMHSKPCKHAKYNAIHWTNAARSKHLRVFDLCPIEIYLLRSS